MACSGDCEGDPTEHAPSPKPHSKLAERAAARTFGLRGTLEAPWSRLDGRLFLLVRPKDLQRGGTVGVKVPDLRPAEKAYVLLSAGDLFEYLGVALFDSQRGL